jgi:hypothetical protein
MKTVDGDCADEVDWTFELTNVPFMTSDIFELINNVLNGNRMKITPDQMHAALHVANYIESPFLLNMLLTKCLKNSKFGKIDDLPEFASMCIAQDLELGQRWFRECMVSFNRIDTVERLWSDNIFWKYSPSRYHGFTSCWHAMWDLFDVTKEEIAQEQFDWMYNKGMVHLFNMFPLNEEHCPVYKLLMDNYSPPGTLKLTTEIEPPDWLITLLQTVPGYLTRPVLFGKMRRSLAEFIVLNGQYKLLNACVDHIPLDTRTAGNQQLMDISIHHRSDCFDVLAENGFLPSEAIWRKVVDKATVQRYFITNEVHSLTSTPGVPLIPPDVSTKMLQYISFVDNLSGHLGNTNRIYTNIKYLYNWNAERRNR